MAITLSERPWLKNYPPSIPTEPELRDVPVPTLLEESVQRHPDMPAVRFYHVRLTYAELWAQVDRAARAPEREPRAASASMAMAAGRSSQTARASATL